mmetsp:Transcript_14697/g.35413  ORF Transcript_14697/g.35413 Transcript_14697/m.35413 type:complete len:195 (+) Transcript_14697:171-755(+)|eukprot:CAMPEP_0181128930 /NCGR_PEP_ID=MMETSP1071-20121207/29041_1 /TAXON_ID=35127 /ORGANISM="Thalassiosira sp., Strain NH16" /LENGTH=194 /DNA_ID=CAMNT_0023214863 /DNA_START=309 /DNA_END=893 /DNA_ORIENTATION=+
MFPGLGGATLPTGAPAAEQEPGPAEDGTKLVDLSAMLDKTLSYARNENTAYPWGNLFIGDSRLGTQSDADEQLILHLTFQEFVKVKSIKFTEWNRGANPDMNPVTVHIHVNRNNLGFEDIEDVDPAQSITLTSGDLQEISDAIDLYYVKFQRVKSLTLFIEDNAGGDVTAIGGLKIMGRTIATTNMNDFKSKQG